MANTAINHDPAATFPGSSTDTAVVKWSGTGGKTLANSGVTIDASNNLTVPGNITTTGYLHLTGDTQELRFYENGNFIAIKAPSLGADYTLTLPINDGSADEFLQTNGSGVLVWAAAAGTTINSNADNRVITGSGTANTLNGESNLTYTGTELVLTGTGISSIERQTSGTNSISAPVHIRNKTSNDAADGFGPVINFQMTDTGVTDQQMGYLGYERHGADNSARFLINVMNAGSLVEGFLMDNTGALTMPLQPTVSLHHSAAQTVGSSSTVAILFDTENWKVGDSTQHSNSSNTSRLYARTAGKYLCAGTVSYSNNNSGWRYMEIAVNGSEKAFDTRQAVQGNRTRVNMSYLADLDAGDYVEFRAYQTSGSTLNIERTGNEPNFWFIKVA